MGIGSPRRHDRGREFHPFFKFKGSCRLAVHLKGRLPWDLVSFECSIPQFQSYPFRRRDLGDLTIDDAGNQPPDRQRSGQHNLATGYFLALHLDPQIEHIMQIHIRVVVVVGLSRKEFFSTARSHATQRKARPSRPSIRLRRGLGIQGLLGESRGCRSLGWLLTVSRFFLRSLGMVFPVERHFALVIGRIP
jgi:hypothetical protein